MDEFGLLKERLATGDDEAGAIEFGNRRCQFLGRDFEELFFFGKLDVVLMLPRRVLPVPGVGRIAPMTVEITKREPQKNSGGAERGTFALQGVKDLGRSIGKAGNFHAVRLKQIVSLEKAAE